MKTVELNISDRWQILRIFDTFKGSMEGLAKLLDDAKVLSITDEEWEQAKLVKTPVMNPDGTRSENWTWDATLAPVKSVELNDSSVSFVLDYIKEKNDKNELTIADKDLIQLKQILS